MQQIPDWISTSRTILIPKNQETHLPNNFRPIACQNIMFKAYTSIVNTFLDDHCTSNGIIATEQAGGKKGSWGCTDQLLINGMILDEVRTHKRNLVSMWFDYKKAFDSVSHEWLLKALELAKVPMHLVIAVENLTKVWATKAFLHSQSETQETDTIKYLNGILQGDSLSLLLFTLTLNPLSFLLNQTLTGYRVGKPGDRDCSVTHLLFVDDLKTYATTMKQALVQLDVITNFTSDIGMKFGADKCAYINIEKGQIRT